jgi:hypothetical protein
VIIFEGLSCQHMVLGPIDKGANGFPHGPARTYGMVDTLMEGCFLSVLTLNADRQDRAVI